LSGPEEKSLPEESLSESDIKPEDFLAAMQSQDRGM